MSHEPARGEVRQSRSLLLLAAAVLLSRVPFMLSGYGADGDAWRVASSATNLWKTGRYTMSRPPGYPLHELLSAPLVGLGGAPLSNGITALASVATLAVFFGIVRHRTRKPLLLTTVFAFTPLFWINSAATMDYVWSLLFIMLALHLALDGKAFWSGIGLGLAIGFRPVNAVALLPLAAALLVYRPSFRIGTRLLVLVFGSVVTAALCFTPVLWTYGVGGWLDMITVQAGRVSSGFGDTFLSVVYRSVYAVGPLAVLAAGWVAISGRRRLLQLVGERDPLAMVAVVGLAAFVLVFAAFPLEKSYLLPGIPFLLLLMERLATRVWFGVFALALLVFGFVNPDVVRHEGVRGIPDFNVRAGMVIEEWQKREEVLLWRKETSLYPFPQKTIVLTGAGPVFWFENEGVELSPTAMLVGDEDEVVRQKRSPSVYFVPMLPLRELHNARRAGYRIVCSSQNREYVESLSGYTMEEMGILLHPSTSQ